MVLRDLGQQRLEYFQRQFQPVNFFGVNGQVDVSARRLLTQTPDAWHQFRHDPLDLGVFVARVQRAEFDGYAIIELTSP